MINYFIRFFHDIHIFYNTKHYNFARIRREKNRTYVYLIVVTCRNLASETWTSDRSLQHYNTVRCIKRDVLKLLPAIPQNGLRDVAWRNLLRYWNTLGIKGRCAYVQLGEIIAPKGKENALVSFPWEFAVFSANKRNCSLISLIL